MALKLQLFVIYIVSLVGRSAANGLLVTAVKWRACEGYATNLKYITGTGVSYTPSWAGAKEESDFLDAGKSSDVELEAACNALLEAGQIGEIYTMKAENCNGNTDCLRMAVYNATEDGLLIGNVGNPSNQVTWVCGKDAPPPTRPECPTKVPSTLQAHAKWRACEGYASNVMYITGTNVNYIPGWAGASSKNELLDAGKTSSAELQAACDALVLQGQVGEIFHMEPDNCDGKTDCLRMAIYNMTEEGLVVGTVSDTGDQKKFVCGKGAPPPIQPECHNPAPAPAALMCGEVKNAYKASNCCGNPNSEFKMDELRRLAPSKSV